MAAEMIFIVGEEGQRQFEDRPRSLVFSLSKL